MPDILPVLLMLSSVLPKTKCRQLHRIVEAMLAMTGRITQRGIARWSGPGGSYRTVHRFFHTKIDWTSVKWRFFELFVYDPAGVYLLAGDETVISKAGKCTHGLDRFFSSLADKPIPGIACFWTSVESLDSASSRRNAPGFCVVSTPLPCYTWRSGVDCPGRTIEI